MLPDWAYYVFSALGGLLVLSIVLCILRKICECCCCSEAEAKCPPTDPTPHWYQHVTGSSPPSPPVKVDYVDESRSPHKDRTVVASRSRSHGVSGSALPTGLVPIVSDTLTTAQLKILMQKALSTVKRIQMYETEWLNRNGPDKYFRYDIMVKQKGILKPTLKDRSGHKNNALNGCYEGIFFMANVEKNGLPKAQSPFGPRRLLIPAYQLLKDCNLYFADFYCNKPNTKHYVLIVAAKPETEKAKFCDQYLVKLDKASNQFLKLPNGSSTMRFNPSFWIEVMYSHNINVKDWIQNRNAQFYDVHSTGVKSKAGLLRNTSCTICSI